MGDVSTEITQLTNLENTSVHTNINKTILINPRKIVTHVTISTKIVTR